MLPLIRLATMLLLRSLTVGCSSDDGGAAHESIGSDEIQALIEDYLASRESKDEQSLRAWVIDSFIINQYHYSLKCTLVEVINDDADGAVSESFVWDWQNEIVVIFTSFLDLRGCVGLPIASGADRSQSNPLSTQTRRGFASQRHRLTGPSAQIMRGRSDRDS
jgi:hypothetical protein